MGRFFVEEYGFDVFSILGYVFLVIALPKEENKYVMEGWMEGFKDLIWDVVGAWGFSPG